MSARAIGTVLAVSVSAAGMLAAFRRGFGAGLAAGYKYGEQDGRREGAANARLNEVLATPTLDDHFGQALLSGVLHEPVGEEMASLLGAVQEHERAAGTETGR